VVTIQGTIIGEKDQGTAAWMMSKPVSRTSFIMSKIVAHTFGFLITAVLVLAILVAVILARQFPGIDMATMRSRCPSWPCRRCSVWL